MIRTAHVSVDFSKSAGPVRALNGGNLGPRFYRPDNSPAEFKTLRIPLTRLHDAPLCNYAMKLVDIHHVFPLFHADENDPRNYYFKQTDDYIRTIIECGSRVLYRLGTSIEHSKERYFVYPPEDYEKWTRICINIMRHYLEGWGNGYNWRTHLKHWEIWNEPDGGLWNSTNTEFCKLFETAAKAIKARFPYVKIGGPAQCSLQGAGNLKTEFFLTWCRDHQVPLDFFSWHNYSAEPQFVIDDPARGRKLLDSYGFTETELQINEWHRWCKDGWTDPASPNCMNSIRSGVHALAVLTGWQDTPITDGCFYTIGYLDWSGPWGCWDSNGNKNKLYQSFLMFAKLLDYPERVKAKSSEQEVRILPAVSPDGKAGMIVTSFMAPCRKIAIEIAGAELDNIRIEAVDAGRDWVEVPFKKTGKTITFETPEGEAAAYFITAKKK